MNTFINPGTNEREKIGLSAGAQAADYVFMAAMSFDWATLSRAEGLESISDEVGFCMNRLQQGLRDAGAELSDLVKAVCWISDESHRDEFEAAFSEACAPGEVPLHATLVAGIAAGCRVEIDAIAYRRPAENAISVHTDVPFVYATSLAIDLETQRRLPDATSIEEETRLVVEGAEKKLRAQGLSLRNVIKTTLFVNDADHRVAAQATYREAFAPGPFPARCTFVGGLAGDCRVQLEVVAAREALRDVPVEIIEGAVDHA